VEVVATIGGDVMGGAGGAVTSGGGAAHAARPPRARTRRLRDPCVAGVVAKDGRRRGAGGLHAGRVRARAIAVESETSANLADAS